MTFKVKDGLALGSTTILDSAGNVTVPEKLTLSNTTTARASLNLGSGAVDPSAPATGDIWLNSGTLKVRQSAATVTVATTSNNLSAFASTTSAQLAGVISDETGTGSLVFATSPTLVTPTLGVATATSVNKVTITAPATGSTLTIADGKTLTASNTLTFTGTDASSVAFGAGGTVVYTSNKLSALSATTSAELAGVISDETGTGSLVFANSPTLVTPTLGVATATSINKVSITAPTTNATLTIADTKAVTISNSLTFTGTDLSSVAFGTGGTVVYTSNKLSALSATSSTELAGVISDETGSGSLVFANSPSLTTPSLGAATATTINKVTITAPTTNATLTIADGKTATISNTLTFTGTDASTISFGAGGTVAYTNSNITGTATTATNLIGGNNTTLLGAVPYQSNTNVTTLLSPNTSTTKMFLSQTGTGTNGAAPVWSALANADIPATLTGKTYNGLSLTANTTGFSVAGGSTTSKTLTLNNTLTFQGTDASTVSFGTGGTVAYTSNNLSVFSATTSAQLASLISDETGSGALVFGTSPTFTTDIRTPLIYGSTGASGSLALASTTNVTKGAVIVGGPGDAVRLNTTTNGFVKTSGGNGTLSYDTSTYYATGGIDVAVTDGGTGTSTAPTAGGIIYGASTSAYASTAAGTAGAVLRSGGGAAPSWSSATFPSTVAVGDILYGSAINTVSALAVGASGKVLKSNGSTISWETDLNTFPTTWTWTDGAVSGPTATITGTSSDITVAAVPAASATTSGIITTGTQTIAGAKTFNSTITGTISKASTLSQGGGSGTAMTFNYAGQTGQPTWLWGTNNGTSINVYNPSNFAVSTAANLSTTRADWSSNGTISAVVGQLAWKNYGNGHTIFDASAGTAPDGTAVNNTTPSNLWSATYPTLMGWNGSATYGVRVDRSRSSETSANILTSAGSVGVDFDVDGNGTVQISDGTAYSNMVGGIPPAAAATIIGTTGYTSGNGRFAIKLLEGNAVDALKLVVGSPVENYGDTCTIGNSTIAGVFRSGLAIAGREISLISNGTQYLQINSSGVCTLNGTASSAAYADSVAINYNNDSNSSYQMLWGSGNGVYGTAGVTVNPATDTVTMAGLVVAGGTSTTITLGDSDEGERAIHNNSNRIGFLTQAGGWGSYCDDSGNWTAVGDVTAYSDERLKKDWSDLPTDFVSKLASVKTGTYTRIDNEERQVGVSAQSLQAVLPEAVVDGEILSVAYGNAALAAAVMLARKIEELEARIKILEAR